MAEFNNAGGISLKVLSTSDLMSMTDEEFAQSEEDYAPQYDSLVSYITGIFHDNRRIKEESGIEDDILDSLRAFSGEYSREDKARIVKFGGSQIFMNLTATKARAAKSWIADILKPSTGEPWSMEPTPISDLPTDIREMLEAALSKEFEEKIKEGQPQAAPVEGQPVPSGVETAQETIREANQRKRDLEKAVEEEIFKEAKWQLEKMQRKIRDQLKEGDWDKALGDFLDDFVVSPTAFMKGPVIQNSKKLMWVNGAATEIKGYKYLNERVNALDMYPSPNSTTIDDGDLCEVIRFTPAKIEALKGVDNYIDENIEKVIEDDITGLHAIWTNTGVEEDKSELEKRGNSFAVQRGTIYGLHFWGNVKVKELRAWDFHEKIKDLEKQEDNDIVAIEALMVGNHVIKCAINDDPLGRRPYFKASFMNIPGSFWGKSLPTLMESVQRMCNAVARALSNNLGIASGPQIELYVDRLADSGDIGNIEPMKIWQLKSDPSGAGGRAINFWQPTSNASELLSVYNTFEEKADDITGIPKYAYGNDNTKGATQTAQGLAMLLETTSKIIKDCIRNIDDGLIKPRIMYQFHYNMINTPANFNYTGDINVCTVGSGTLTVKGAEAQKRNEFLMATTNPTDMGVMGIPGRAAILRKMGEDLGLPNVIPSDFELAQKIKKDEIAAAANAKAQQAIEAEKATQGLKATTVQIEGQKQMHQLSVQERMQKLQADMQKHQDTMSLEMAELKRKMDADQGKLQAKIMEEENKSKMQTQEVALSIQKGEGI